MKTEVLIKQRISNDAGNRQAGRVSRSDPSQNLLKFVCGGIQLFSTSISRLALLLRRDDTAFFSALCGTNSVIPTTMSIKPPRTTLCLSVVALNKEKQLLFLSILVFAFLGGKMTRQ